MAAPSSLIRHPEFRAGALDMLGAAMGVLAWGLMTGVAMAKSGMGPVEAVLMAVTVFAGSSQLTAIPLILASAPAWVILAAATCVNLRFVVFSAHVRPYVMHLPRWRRLIVGYLMADHTYVMFVQRFAKPAVTSYERDGQMAYLVATGVVNWVSWTLSSLLGIVLANFIPPSWGLGFAGILALVGMTFSLASSRLRWMAAAVAGTVAVIGYALPFKLNIVVAIGVAVMVCLVMERTPLHTQDPAAERD